MPAGKTRNPEIAPGVRQHGSGAMYRKRGTWIKTKKASGKTTVKVAKAGPVAKKQPFGKDGKKERLVAPRGAGFFSADQVKHRLGNNKKARPTKLRPSLVPGAILILLAGKYRGRRVILLKQLPSGLLLVTGPYAVNGVPLRRVNHRYVIGTSTHVDISGVKIPDVDDAYFKKDKHRRKKTEAAFFGDTSVEKPKNILSDKRKADQKAVDGALLSVISKTPQLKGYLGSNFTLRSGQHPHQLKF